MADNPGTPSLVGMISATGGKANREVKESRFKTVKQGNDAPHGSAQAKRGGFDGFLNTFLGKDKAGAGISSCPGKTKIANKTAQDTPSLSDHLKNNGKPSRKSGSGTMAADERRALRKSMEKTVAEDRETAANSAETAPEAYPPEVVAAAEEAAALIWNLLYGQTDFISADMDMLAGDMAGIDALNAEMPGGDALKTISRLIDTALQDSALSGLGTQGAVDLSALQDAIDTANASAEMNSAAVLSALDDLLDGMPRQALEEALARTADAMGLPAAVEGDEFNRIAAALGAEVVDVGGGEAELLSLLGGASVHTDATVQDGAAVATDASAHREVVVETDVAVESDAAVLPGADVPDDVRPVTDAEAAVDSEESVPADAMDNEAAAPVENNHPEAAKNSGKSVMTEVEAEELAKIFVNFIKENPDVVAKDAAAAKSGAAADALAQGEKVLRNFAEWLQDTGKAKEAKQLSAETAAFIRVLAKTAAEGLAVSAETGEKISLTKANLEVFLQNIIGKTGNAARAALEENEPLQTLAKTAVQFEPGAGEDAVGNIVGIHGQSRQTPAAAQAGTANPSAMSTMLDQMENIERLSEAMKMSAKNGIKDLTMQLTPAELGKVMLRVESVNGAINAYLRVEKPEAAAQLGSALDQLRETLKAQGIELGELSLRQQGAHEALGDFSGQRQSGREANESREKRRGRRGFSGREDAGPDAPEAVSAGRAGPGALNLFA